ncbi:hypothetical protein G5B35_15295 [Parapusillimonas sp. SGNA-6]|nr:hypothetical protein [Parapusillimonas sp. SGNA-6]
MHWEACCHGCIEQFRFHEALHGSAFVDRANEAGWKTIEQASPKYASELKKLFGGS